MREVAYKKGGLCSAAPRASFQPIANVIMETTLFRSSYLALALAMSATLISCGSDPKAANNGNFAHAIDTFLEKSEKAGKMSLCMKNPARIPDDVSAGADGAARRAILDPYVRAGLATRHEAMKPVNSYSYSRNPPMHQVVEYKPSAVGQSAIQTETNMFGGRTIKLCYGSFRVSQIVNFTEPADVNGYRVSQVRWIPRVSSVADWAKTDGGKALVGAEITSAEHDELNAIAALTSTGWEAGMQ